MKKKFVFTITFLVLASTLLAEDAKVLPWMTGRISVEPVYSFAPGGYDNNMNYISYGNDSAKVFSIGFAFEYGVTDWFTAAIRSGWIPWSDMRAITGIDSNINGIQDFYLMTKFQIIGDRAPIKLSRLRFAITPLVVIPLSESPDMSTESLATGARVFFDIVPNYYISINFFGEGIFYPANMPNYDMSFALEPVLTLPMSRGIDLSIGLPAKYEYFYEYPAYTMSLGPNLSIFFFTLTVPLELTLQYNLPLLGSQSPATQSASLLVKVYFGSTSGAF